MLPLLFTPPLVDAEEEEEEEEEDVMTDRCDETASPI